MKQDKKKNKQEWLEVNESTMNHFGKEISSIEILILGLKEMQYQYDSDMQRYKTTSHFWHLTYKSYWKNLIIDLVKVVDTNYRSISMKRLLEKQFNEDPEAKRFFLLFAEDDEKSIYKKIKTLRDQIFAHAEGDVFASEDKLSELLQKNKCDLSEIEIFVCRLKDLFECLSKKLEIRISLVRPNSPIRKEIKEIFEKL